jgi:hypothetical protein
MNTNMKEKGDPLRWDNSLLSCMSILPVQSIINVQDLQSDIENYMTMETKEINCMTVKIYNLMLKTT